MSASFNTLSLVHRDEGLMRFVKFVSHLAPSSRWDVAMQYTVDAVESSDDEDEDEDDEENEEEDEEEMDDLPEDDDEDVDPEEDAEPVD